MKTYTCPMHPEVEQNEPGRCPKCGMNLVEKEVVAPAQATASKDNYTPLIVIFSLLIIASLIASWSHLPMGMFWHSMMMNLMAGFFIVFAGFKLFDLKGFAEGYSTYDLIAQKWFGYGYIYPFLELGLGLLYFARIVNDGVLLATLILMTISGLGVAIKLAKKEKFQCACLGTFLKVPLTKISLAEDFGMALMALVMLAM